MEIRRHLKIYLLLVKASWLAFLAHRFEVVMSSLANLVWTTSQLIGLSFLVQRMPVLQNWTKSDLVLLLSLSQVYFYTSYIVYASNLDDMGKRVIEGTLDFHLLKPVNVQFLNSFEKTQISQIFSFTVACIPLIVYAFVTRTAPVNSILVIEGVIVLVVGLIVLYLLRLTMSGLVFFFDEIESVNQLVFQYMNDFVRTPLDALPKILLYLFTFIIPYAFASYYPVMIINGNVNFIPILGIGILLAIVLYWLSGRVWKGGLKRYAGAS